MARISGITIPNDKQIWVALTYVHGIGRKSSYDILKKSNVDSTIRVKDLSNSQITKIQDVISAEYTVEGDLQRIVTGNIKRLKDIKSYRGLRHIANLPTRGQRTRTNARTKRGKRVTIGGTAKKTASKT
jgi:small subunit ribosomal protein S13